MKYYVGLDLGGTKTDVLVGDENGKLLSRYLCPTGHVDNYTDFLINCIEKAVNQSNLKLIDAHAFAICVPWVVNEEGENNNETNLRKRLSNDNIIARSDIYGGWRAETNQLPSGVLSAGTGAGLAFFTENGKAVIIGESVLPEFQSGSALGFRGFGRGLSSALGYYEPTLLSESVCEFAETSRIEEACKKTNYGLDRDALPYRLFSPHVLAAAQKNDKVAIELINDIGAGLATHIRAGIRALGLENQELPFVLSGGILKGQNNLLEKVIRNRLADITNLNFIRAECEPVFGALMLAYDKYGVSGTLNVTDEDLREFNLYR